MSQDNNRPQPSIGARAVKDTTRQFAAQMVVGLCAAFFSAWLNRMLPSRDLAVWPIAIQVAGFIAAMSSWGVGDTFLRLVPELLAKGQRTNASALLRTGLLLNTVSALAVACVVYWQADIIGTWLLHDDTSGPTIRLIASAALFGALYERVKLAVESVQAFRALAWLTTITGVLRTPLFVVCYVLGGVKGFLLGINAIAAVQGLWAIGIIWPYLRHSRSLWPAVQLVRFSIPFYGVSLLGFLSGRVNYLVVGALTTPKVLASYFVADSVVSYIRYLGMFATSTTAPKLVERTAGDRSEAARVFTKCTRYIALGVYPAYIIGAALSPLLIQAYGGAKYIHATSVLMILCGSLLVETLTDLHSTSLRAFAAPWHTFANSLITSVANILPLLLFVPLYGSVGAAMAVVLKFAAMSVISGWVLSRNITLRYDWSALQKALWASVPAALVALGCYALWDVRTRVLIPAGLLCLVAYAAGLARQITRQDVSLLEESLPRSIAGRPITKRLMAFLTWLWVPSAERDEAAVGARD